MTSLLPTIDGPVKPVRRRRILSTRTADACLDWVVFPALLFIQFGATMCCHSQQGILDLNWVYVIGTVFVFCVVAGVYRQILRNHPSESLPLLLVPEIATNILLALVMMAELKIAFEALIIMTVVLVLLGTMAQIHILHLQRVSVTVEQDYQPLPGPEEEGPDSDDEWIC